MADSLFRRPYFWARLHLNPLGELIEVYVKHFRGLGYTWLTVRSHVQALEYFGCWPGSKGLGANAVNRELAQCFIREHLPRCRCPRPAPVSLHQVRPALKHLLAVARKWGAD